MKTKKVIAAILILVLGIFTAVTGAGCGDSAVSNSTDTTEEPAEFQASSNDISGAGFSIRANCGLQGNYRSGAAVPVTLSMESLEKDFEGVVRIIVPGSSDMGVSSSAYEKEVMLAAGEEKVVTMSVYNMSGTSKFTLQLEDAKGKILLEQSITLNGISGTDALVGVLSDDYTALNYFDKQIIMLDGYDWYEDAVQLVELDAATLPEQSSGLDALSYLIINSYDSSKLTESQIAAIESWVDRGGVLILGAGSDYQQTLSGFQNRMIEAEVSGMAEGTLALKDEDRTAELSFSKDAGIISLSLADGADPGSVVEQSGLIWMQEYGQGHVVVTAMNLGMEPVVSWEDREAFAVSLLEAAAEGYSSQRITNLNYGYYTNTYEVVNAVNGLYETKTPSVGLISILLLVFVLACPLLYLILKLLDKRELLWGIIPALAVCFTVIMFVSTGDIRIKNPIESSVTVLYEDVDSGIGVEQAVNMAVLVPDADLTRLQLSSSLSNLKMYDTGNYDFISYMFSSSNNKSSTEYNVAVRETPEGYQLGLNNGETFQTNYFGFDSSAETDLSGGLVTDYVKNTTGISGTVTNRTGYDLKGVCVFMNSYYVMIGNLADGETASFQESDNGYFDYFDLYGIDIPGMETYSDEYLHLLSIYEMAFEQYLSNDLYYGQNPLSTYAMGYIGEWDADYVESSKIPEYNKAVLIKKENVGYSDYEGAAVMRLFNYANYSGDWDPYDGEMYALSTDETFDLGMQIEGIYALIRAKDSDARFGNTSDTQIYAWNLETETFDELFTEDLTMKFEDGCPYLSEDGQIRLRFTCREEWTDYVPEITVVGGMR